MRELTYFVATSLDGFIAGPNGEFDAFLAEGDHLDAINARYSDTVPTHAAQILGVEADGAHFDTVVMGWNTYAVALPYGITSPYQHLRQVVFSRQHAAGERIEGVEITDEDPVEVVRELKAENGSGIWLCGGGALAAALADEIDRLVLKINPVLFGDGIRLFGTRDYGPARFAHTATETFSSGVVIVEYRRA